MTTLPPSNGREHDPTAAVSGLAREVEALRRRQDQLDGLSGKVRELARVVTDMVAEVANMAAAGPSQRTAALSWLAGPPSPEQARKVLDELVDWVMWVFLRYADARKALPECWLWHPDIVEELFWLMQAWQAAYQADDASLAQAADWHDRYRPGVVRRLPQLARHCSLEQHTDSNTVTAEQPVMDPAARDQIAHWWGTDPNTPAPIPTAEQLTDATNHDEDRGQR